MGTGHLSVFRPKYAEVDFTNRDVLRVYNCKNVRFIEFRVEYNPVWQAPDGLVGIHHYGKHTLPDGISATNDDESIVVYDRIFVESYGHRVVGPQIREGLLIDGLASTEKVAEYQNS